MMCGGYKVVGMADVVHVQEGLKSGLLRGSGSSSYQETSYVHG